MIGRKSVYAVVCLLLASVAMAQTAAPSSTPGKRVVVRAARMLDVKSGQYVQNPEIVIEGEKIVSITPGSQAAEAHARARPPQAANKARLGDPGRVPQTQEQVINLPNMTLLPGLIDAHTHITFDPYHFGYPGLGISVPRQALYGAKYAKITLEAGFTTIRNVGASGYSDVALRDAINAGDVPGPRMMVSGPALSITGGHCDNNLLPFEYRHSAEGVADGVEAVQHKVREIIKYGADVIKICATGGVLSKGDDPQHAQYTLEEMQAIVADAHRLGRKVAAHAHGAQGIRWAAEAGVDSIEHGSYLDDAGIAVMKQHGTYLVPTQYLMDWMTENMVKIGLPAMYQGKMRDVIAASRKNVAHAMASGVKIAFGTDAAVYPHGLNAHEFAVYVKMGMSPLGAIQSATVNAADLLGWSDRVGAIEAGKYADMIAVSGDPLQDVTVLQDVKWVMKGGEVEKSSF